MAFNKYNGNAQQKEAGPFSCDTGENSMKRPALTIAILTVPMLMGQIRPEEKAATMSERTQQGLHGPVRLCTETSTFASWTDAEGKSYPQVRSEYTTEYDHQGRTLTRRTHNPDGSEC